jgi:hypothetical protein
VFFIQLCQSRSGWRLGFLFWAAALTLWRFLPSVEIRLVKEPELPSASAWDFAIVRQLNNALA